MSYPQWDSIPLLALKGILEYLSDKDALAAMSTCRHWRSAMLMFEGHRDLLELNVNEYEKSILLVRLYKKHLRKLHIYNNSTVSESMLSAFMCYVMPQILDSNNLQEMVFVGPIHTSHDKINSGEIEAQAVQVRRIITEIFLKPSPLLERLAIFGCDMNFYDEDNNICMQKENDFDEPDDELETCSEMLSEYSVLQRCNDNLLMCSSIKHLVLEYELLSAGTLGTLTKLNSLRVLTLNIVNRNFLHLKPVNWNHVLSEIGHLEVTVNIISVPVGKLQYVMDNALCGGMPLTKLKVMFCQVLSMRLICHVSREFHSSLRELVWVDTPAPAKSTRLIRLHYGEDLGAPFNHMNPFIFLAWQCQLLRKIVVHGYWLCEYDLLGIIRLRKGIELDVSAVYMSTAQFDYKPQQVLGCVIRVLSYDTPTPGSKNNPVYLLREMEDNHRSNGESELKPSPWHPLPLGLQAKSTPSERADYIVQQSLLSA